MKTLICLLLLPFSGFAQNLRIEGPIRFLALGDSYTIGQSVPINQRWPVQLADSLALRGFQTDSIRIIATTGWRTDNLLNALYNQHLVQGNFNLVSVLIGVNNQYQNRPFSQYQSEFPQLLDSAIRFAGGDTERVFVVSIADYAFTPFGLQSGNGPAISSQIDQYNEFNRQKAGQFHIPYFDITGISRLGLAQPGMVAGDGLHPSGYQYTLWVRKILAHIDSVLLLQNSLKVEMVDQIFIRLNQGQSEITIQFEKFSGAETQVSVYDLFGRRVLKELALNETVQFNVSALPNGVYNLVCFRGNQLCRTRFSILR